MNELLATVVVAAVTHRCLLVGIPALIHRFVVTCSWSPKRFDSRYSRRRTSLAVETRARHFSKRSGKNYCFSDYYSFCPLVTFILLELPSDNTHNGRHNRFVCFTCPKHDRQTESATIERIFAHLARCVFIVVTLV